MNKRQLQQLSLGTLLLITCLLFAACERHFSTRESDLIVSEDYPRVVNLAAQVNSGSVRLVWELTDTAATVNCRIFVSDSVNGVYLLRDSVSGDNPTATISSLSQNRRYYFKVAPVMEAGLQGDISNAVTAFVGPLSIFIDNNDTLTTDRNVRVTINVGDGASHVTLSENVNFTGAVQVPLLSNVQNFTLSDGDGIKTVYCRVLFDDGSTTGTPLSDDILLSTSPVPVTLSALAVSTFEISLTWTRSTSQEFASYRVYRGTTPSVTNASQLITTLTSQGTQAYTDTSLSASTVYYYRVYVYDHAGLTSGSNTATATTFVNTAPNAVLLVATHESDSTVSLSWTASDEQDFASYRIYRSNSATVTTASELIGIVSDIGATGFTAQYVTPPATTYFRVFVFDRHGLSTGSNTRSVSP
jgi:uncharacterized protein YcfL